ncbi:MAG: CoA-binding protein [Bacteroidetes bacterium]|nr:MAG: CoA-binding protein [Bacteroidota bacterium]
MKKTVVIGASENTERYSNRITRLLHNQNIPVAAIGLKAGEIDGVKIQTGFPKIDNVDTVTLYVGPAHQFQYYDYVIGLKPARVIFNPGTENPEFEKKVRNAGIEVLEACTLTMLSIGNY